MDIRISRHLPLVIGLVLGLASTHALAQEVAEPPSPEAVEADVSTAPRTLPEDPAAALQLPVEVLRARLRPLDRAQVAVELEDWLAELRRLCEEVSAAEIAAIESSVSSEVNAQTARAVELRGRRGRLVDRVNAVIQAYERKAGDSQLARAYVDSVVAQPPIVGWRAAWSTFRAWLTDRDGGVATIRKLASALGIIFAFWILARFVARVARRGTRSMARSSELFREFITSTARRLTIFLGLLVALSTLGVNMTPLVAAIGAAGLVIGLALQGTLSNLASGLMIMVYRPFDLNDVVTTAGATGKVNGMTLMTTTIRTGDNQTVHVPNNKIWGDVITNVTANATRRVDLTFGIGYGDDITKAKEVLEDILGKHELVLEDPKPVVRVHQLGDSSVNLIARPWAQTPNYWEVVWSLTEAVKRAFDEEGISIPFPQRDVHLHGDTERA